MNVKMPTIVGIFTFICMIHTTSESLKARKVFYISAFYEQSRLHAQFELSCKHEKSFMTLGPVCREICDITVDGSC